MRGTAGAIASLFLVFSVAFLLGGGPAYTGAGQYIKTADPTTTDDEDSGYRIGASWLNTTNDTEWVCLDATSTAAVWKDRTSGAGGGDTHPVVDGTSLVEGSGDDTKEMRIEVDGLTTSTTRVLTMADANIDLTVATGSYATAAEGDLAASAMQDQIDDTTPQWGGQQDVNGFAIGNGSVELVTFVETALAVNEIEITNAVTGDPAILGVSGETNADLLIMGNGTGVAFANADGDTIYTSGNHSAGGGGSSMMGFSGMSATVSKGATEFLGMTGGDAGTTEANAEFYCRVAGTVSDLEVYLSTNDSNNAGNTVTMRLNGSDTTLLVTYGASTTGNLSDLSNSFTVSAGDQINVEVTNTGSGGGTKNIVVESVSVEFAPS